VFADPQGTNCEFVEAYPGVMQVYIVHVGAAEAMASQFMVEASAGFNGIYLGEEMTTGNIKTGNATTGCSVAYGQCHATPINMLMISYYVDGPSDPCSYLEVVPDPKSQTGEINIVDCTGTLVTLEVGGRGNFNVAAAPSSCDCSDPLSPVATEVLTWGQVKALYRD